VTEPEAPPPLGYEQTARVLAKLADLDHPIVLVGGQALNFWANFYEAKVPALAAGAPYTSKDIDFVGSHEAVRECARRLGGTARLATLDDMGTPNTGIVLFVDDDEYTRQIDFLGEVAGVDAHDTHDSSIGATILDERGDPISTFRVMHPILCLKSRAHNVAFLPGYQGAHALNQLRAAILCAKEFSREMLESDPFATLKFNEQVFDIAQYGAGVVVHVRHGIDVFDAVVMDEGMPEKFYSERLPRVRAAVERAREKGRAAAERSRIAKERSERKG